MRGGDRRASAARQGRECRCRHGAHHGSASLQPGRRRAVDCAGNPHPGLILIGIPVLDAPKDDLPRIRRKAVEAGNEVVDFPIQGQQTNDYAEFRRLMSDTAPEQVEYLGIMLLGAKSKVGRIVGKYSLLRQP